MLLSARQAAAELASAGLTRAQAVRLLDAGFAGMPQFSGRQLLFEEATVRALAGRPRVATDAMPEPCRGGLLVLRRQRGVDLLRPDSVSEVLACGLAMSAFSRVAIRERVETEGQIPCVVTVCGYVAAGVDVIGVDDLGADSSRQDPGWRAGLAGDSLSRLQTRSAGAWFDHFEGRRFPTSRGGPWLVWRGR